MKKLKHFLSLTLATAMLMSMMVIHASASHETFVDADSITNTEAVTAMVNLGILEGSKSSFNPEGTVTRGQMAKIICLILTGGEEPEGYTYTFTDIEGHWAEQYIAYCAYKHIIDGKSDEIFDPSEPVTGYEAAKMVLTALGYDSDVQGYTGATWKNAVTSDAADNKLTTDLKAANSSFSMGDDISRDDVAEMIFTALNCKTVSYPTSSSTIITRGETMLSRYFSVETVTGVVTSNDFYGKTGYTVVNGISYNGISGADVFGRSVTFYVDGNNTIIGSITLTGDDSVVTVKGTGKKTIEDLASDYTFSGDTVAYYFGDACTVDDTDTDKMVVGEYAEVIVSGDDALCVIVYSYSFGKVTTYEDTKFGVTIDGNEWTSDPTEDHVVGYEDLSKGDYVNAIYIDDTVYVSLASSVTGEFSYYTPNGSNYSTITVDGTKYTMAIDASIGSYALDSEVTLYTDILGYVVKVDAQAESTPDGYALVLAAAINTSTSVGVATYTPEVQVLLDNGSTKIYPLAKLDGMTFNNSADDDSTTQFNGNDLSSGLIDTICTYTIQDDEITLTTAGSDGEEKNVTSIKNGALTVPNAGGFATNSTVFFLYDSESESYGVYTGYDAVPSFTPSHDSYVWLDDSDVAAIYAYGTADQSTFSGGWLYLYKSSGTSSVGNYYNAVVDGEITSSIAVSSGDDQGTGTFYRYDYADGSYTIVAANETNGPTGFTDGTVVHAGRSTCVISYTMDGQDYTEEFAVHSDSSLCDNTDSMSVTDTTLAKGDTVDVIYDNNGIIALVITDNAD